MQFEDKGWDYSGDQETGWEDVVGIKAKDGGGLKKDRGDGRERLSEYIAAQVLPLGYDR